MHQSIVDSFKFSGLKQFLIVFAVIVVVCLVAVGHFRYDISWEDLRQSIESAPAWIFLGALVFLPPLAFPLSVFLVAVGARFEFVYAALFATLAIIAHHVLAVGISSVFSGREINSNKATGVWEQLDEKFGGNSSKLLFVWGLTPGIPYSIKLYLPLAMGVKAIPFVLWNGTGHVMGAIIFVGFGRALFSDFGVGAIAVIAGVIILFGLVYLLRKKVIPD